MSNNHTIKTALAPAEQGLVIVTNELLGLVASQNGDNTVNTNQMHAITGLVGVGAVAASLLDLRMANRADIVSDDQSEISGIYFPPELGSSALQGVAETVPALPIENLPPQVAVERFLHQEGGTFSAEDDTSALSVLCKRMESHGYGKHSVHQAVRMLTRKGITTLEKRSPRFVNAIQLITPHELSDAAKNAVPGTKRIREKTAPTEEQRIRSERKALALEYLRLRGAGFYRTEDASINSQIEKMVEEKLGITTQEAQDLRKVLREDKSMLSVSFPHPENLKVIVVEYVGLNEFMDDPISEVQTVVGSLRESIAQHRFNAIMNNAPFSPEAQKYAALARKITEIEWNKYPYPVLSAYAEDVCAALRAMTLMNKQTVSK